jgi:hypothetical protein
MVTVKRESHTTISVSAIIGTTGVLRAWFKVIDGKVEQAGITRDKWNTGTALALDPGEVGTAIEVLEEFLSQLKEEGYIRWK